MLRNSRNQYTRPMLRSAYLLSFRHRAAWLLAFGLLAVALQTLAGANSMRAGSTVGKGDSFVAELCTSHGVFKIDSAQTAGGGSQQGSGAHDCCQWCAAGGPMLVAAGVVGVPPAPTFVARLGASAAARPALAVSTAHPPRGPPARA